MTSFANGSPGSSKGACRRYQIRPSSKQKSVALAKTRLAAISILPQQNPTRLSNDTAIQKPADHKPGLRHSTLGVWPITAISTAAVLLVVLIGFVLWDLTVPSLPQTVGGTLGTIDHQKRCAAIYSEVFVVSRRRDFRYRPSTEAPRDCGEETGRNLFAGN